jgi:hypothetical protein
MIDQLLQEQVYDLHWQMGRCERLVMERLLVAIRPRLAIEIGTYLGGSMQVIAKNSDRVISLDMDDSIEGKLGSRFPNVEFIAGRTRETLPTLVEKLNKNAESPDFILVDGDHSLEGVRDDINLLLTIHPQRNMVIIMHDSFNPYCRAGMLAAGWGNCPYVHAVEIDFVPGVFFAHSYDTAEAGSMWAGFGCAFLTPTKRTTELKIQQSHEAVFNAVKDVSIYKASPPSRISTAVTFLRSRLRPIKRRLIGK